MFRKTISLLLAVIFIFSVLPTGASAAVNNDEIYMSENNMNIEGTNAVGKIISGALSTEAQQESENTDYRVTDVTLQDNIATVNYEAKTDCTILVALYDDTSGRFLASGKADTYAAFDKIDVEIKGTMPEYFVTKVFMLNEKNAPLSDVFVSSLYTEEIQKVKNSTVEDYPEEKVVNLDTDNTTNFAVFSDKVKRINNDNETNVIETIDEENGVYVFTNADEQLKNLTAGDIFSFQSDAENVIVIKVKTITTESDKVTIIQEETDAKEVFDYIKIEAQQDAGDCEMDHSTLDKNITCNGVVNNSPKTRAIDESVSVSDKIEYGFDISSDENKSKSIAVGGVVTLGVELAIEVYASLDEFYIDVALEYSLDFGVELIVNSEDVLEEDLSVLIYSPIRGVKVSFTPKIILQAQVKIVLFATISGKLGFNVSDDNGFTNTSKKPEAETRLNIQGDMFIGLALVPAGEIELINYDLAYTEISLSGGVEITVESAEEDDDYDHSCLIGGAVGCFEGKINLKFEISGKAEVFENSYLQKSFDVTAELGEFYYSSLWSDYGWGECPKKIKRTEPTQPTTQPEPTESESLLPDDTEPDSNPEASEPSESNSASEPDSEPEPTETASMPPKPTETDSTEPKPTETTTDIISADKAGDNIYWNIDDNGVLEISGEGAMYDYDHLNGQYPVWRDRKEDFHTVRFVGNITTVGNDAFYYLDNIKQVEFCDSIESINESAFYHCSLENIILPENLTEIKNKAFSYCSSLKTVEFNNKLKTLGDEVFYSDFALEEIRLPDSLENMGDSVFNITGWMSAQEKGVVYSGNWVCGYRPYNSSQEIDIEIAEGTKYIADGALSGCQDTINSLSLPESLLKIGSRAFQAAEITSITLPENLEYIGAMAFFDVDFTKDIIIPASVKYIGNGAFWGYGGAINVYIKGNPEFEEGSFHPYYTLYDLNTKSFCATASGISNCASFNNLMPGMDYIVAVVKSQDVDDLLSADNLLYIDQLTADKSGQIVFNAVPREESDLAECLIFDYEVYLNGDVNMDGKININDVTAIQRHLVGLTELSDKGIKLSDVDNNGTVDINDATTIQYYLVLLPRVNSIVGKYSKVFI